MVKVPAAFERRCIPPDGVVRRLRMPNMRPPHALSAGRLTALGAPRGSTTGCWGGNDDETRMGSFNEAAAYHCGKRPSICRPSARPAGFNEAAAYHCGKRPRTAAAGRARGDASMRPQHITAENARTSLSTCWTQSGFNEAAAYHCGKPVTEWPGAGRGLALQ